MKIGADSRATGGNIIADRNCQKNPLFGKKYVVNIKETDYSAFFLMINTFLVVVVLELLLIQ
jgi:hypothetical protein